jgi:hypothetical protein
VRSTAFLPGGIVEDLLFNTPWWLPTGIAILGIVLFVMGNQRVNGKLRTAGLLVVLAAVLLAVVSYLVDTPKETAEKRTRAIVNVVAGRDWPRLRTLLDQNTSFDIADAHTIPQAQPTNNGPAIAQEAEAASAVIGLHSVNILQMESSQQESLITVTFSAISTQDYSQDRPVKSTWQFSWQRRGNDWFLQQITLRQMQ